ncbi:MAG: hypothetical protein AB7V46_00235 [Thermomicrobiales bacterium]
MKDVIDAITIQTNDLSGPSEQRGVIWVNFVGSIDDRAADIAPRMRFASDDLLFSRNGIQ